MNDLRYILMLSLLAMLTGCGGTNTGNRPPVDIGPGGISSTPLAATNGGTPNVLFRLLSPQETGVDFVNQVDTSHAMKYLYASAMACGGVTIGDIDGDGFADILIGAPFADTGGVTDAGNAYVIYGTASGFGPSLDLGALDGSDGFVLEGVAEIDRTGFSVASAGDGIRMLDRTRHICC